VSNPRSLLESSLSPPPLPPTLVCFRLSFALFPLLPAFSPLSRFLSFSSSRCAGRPVLLPRVRYIEGSDISVVPIPPPFRPFCRSKSERRTESVLPCLRSENRNFHRGCRWIKLKDGWNARPVITSAMRILPPRLQKVNQSTRLVSLPSTRTRERGGSYS